MKKYIVYYHDQYGDLCSCWVYAESKEDAEKVVRDEYWDVNTISEIYEAK